MKSILRKIFFPNTLVGFFSFNLGFALLIYVFLYHLEETPLAYISYVLSFYALVIFCIWFFYACKFSNEYIRESRIYKYYKTNLLTVTKVSIVFSFIINFMFGVFKLYVGVHYWSWWFITFALYYLLLCVMRFILVNNLSNLKRAYKKLAHTGITLLLLNIVLIGIIILIIEQDQVVDYSGNLIYLVALYDFYVIIGASINVFKYRKEANPLFIASKCINLTVAMISMVSLEVAMIYQFGNNEQEFKFLVTASMGFFIFIINSFMSLYMIVKAKKNLI